MRKQADGVQNGDQASPSLEDCNEKLAAEIERLRQELQRSRADHDQLRRSLARHLASDQPRPPICDMSFEKALGQCSGQDIQQLIAELPDEQSVQS
jgi:septal ring factor EnvC (AmiA/AmiB activator)